ncbi:hypothetical protein Tco_0728109 [Tanacetum coccineum]|uniref:Reverse transcriptase domain-containing protein n=1 Tax=Tanacetum coccineum TaxID=301880 RepID=A0ABQ4YN98_9ASTR
MQEVIFFYKGLDVPTRQILDSKGVVPKMNAANAKKAIKEMVDHYQKCHNGKSTRCRSSDTSDGLVAIQAQLNNLDREIKKVNEKVYAAQHTTLNLEYRSPKEEDTEQLLQDSTKEIMEILLKNQGVSIKALEIQIGQMSKVLQERRSGSLPSSTETNPRDHVKSILTTVEAKTYSIRRIEPTQYVVSSLENNMQLSKPDQLIEPTNLKRLLNERSRMNDEIEASMNVHSSTIFEDTLSPKEKDPGSFTIPYSINNICFEKALADLGASVSVMPYSTFTNLGLSELAPTELIIELADRTIKRPKGLVENVLVGIGKFVFPIDFIVLDMLEDIKVPLILGRLFLYTSHAKINVFKRKIALRVGNDKIVFKSDNPTINIIKKVYVLGLREQMELDLEARLMGLTIKEGEVIDEPMVDIVKTRHDDEIIKGIDEYTSLCDNDRKIHINCAYNLQFSCMIGFEHVNSNFFPILSINVMSKKFYNSIMKNKIKYKGKNVVRAFMNAPIFVGNFSVVTDFAVVEIWMLTVIKTWEMLLMGNHFVGLRVLKQEGSMD